MNSRTACRKLDEEEEDECDGDDEDIITAKGRGALRIDGGEKRSEEGWIGRGPRRGKDRELSANDRGVSARKLLLLGRTLDSLGVICLYMDAPFA